MRVDLALEHLQEQQRTIATAEWMLSSGAISSSKQPLTSGAANSPVRMILDNQLWPGASVGPFQLDHTLLLKLGFHGDQTYLLLQKSPPGEIFCPKNNVHNSSFHSKTLPMAEFIWGLHFSSHGRPKMSGWWTDSKSRKFNFSWCESSNTSVKSLMCDLIHYSTIWGWRRQRLRMFYLWQLKSLGNLDIHQIRVCSRVY